jgi:hypothetical protein
MVVKTFNLQREAWSVERENKQPVLHFIKCGTPE